MYTTLIFPVSRGSHKEDIHVLKLKKKKKLVKVNFNKFVAVSVIVVKKQHSFKYEEKRKS